MDRYVSGSRLGEICGVNRAAISIAKKAGKFEGGYKLGEGKRKPVLYDTQHPSVRQYIDEKTGIANITKKPPVTPLIASPEPTETAKSPQASFDYSATAESGNLDEARLDNVYGTPPGADVETLKKMTLGQIVKAYGSLPEFREYLDTYSKMERLLKSQIENDENQGRLISRAYIETHVLGLIEALMFRLLSQFPRATATIVKLKLSAKSSLEEIAEIIHDQVSIQLKDVKGQAVRKIDAV